MEVNDVKTWSHTKVEVVKVSHTWTISNFSYCGEKNGQVLKSETFSAKSKDKLDWCLELYPRGRNEEDKDYVSLYLRLLPCNKDEIEAKVKVVIHNDKMEKFMNQTFDKVFKQGIKETWGYPSFIKRDRLLDNTTRLLSDDKLTIFCEVSVAGETVNVSRKGLPLDLKDPVSSLVENLENLFDTRKFSDVMLIAGTREFQAHKAILAERSAVFSAMFEHEMEERKNNRVNIIDIDDKVIEEMLRFIYTGKVPNIEKMADSLLEAADKYALDSLKLMCQERLYKSLTVENAMDTLVLADIHSCEWLKTQAINFIDVHGTAVMDTQGFKSVATSHPHLIVEILRASVKKRNGDLDDSERSTVEKETSQSPN